MIRIASRLLGAGAILALAACASSPLHYYTLVAPADTPVGTVTVPAAATPSLPFELLPVSVPAQVDQPQLVVRQGAQGMTLLDGERWIAPLSDEVRSALAADLVRQLHSQDVTGMGGSDKPRLRIRLDLRRFDSQPGSYALIEGAWSVSLQHGARTAALACTSRISETVGSGYDALVQGHQRAIGRLAAQIAVAGRALGDGQTPVCPAD